MTELRFSREKKNTGRKAEAATARRVGARLVPGSGGVGRGEGDFKTPEFLFEHKATTADSYRITRRELLKAQREAQAAGRQSVFVVNFVDDREKSVPPGRVYLVDERTFEHAFNSRRNDE